MTDTLVTAKYIRIDLDWTAYYAKFKEMHGMWPVKFKGRLLFEDGWTYSLTDLKGPEWSPPTEYFELWKLHVAYWAIRRRIVKHERDYLRILLDNLRELQRNKSAPLQQRFVAYNEDREGNQVPSYEFKDVDLLSIEEGRLAWLEEDVRECNERLITLQKNKPRRLKADDALTQVQ